MNSMLRVRNKVNRPTENKALGRFTRLAAKAGLSQADLINFKSIKSNVGGKSDVCCCMYCKRRRVREITYEVKLVFAN